ncbi:MAG: WG repeat-containing protein [Firmicutes bacterium]|nr:WG repeat-containing protein [Bacillota bacterium]
MNFFKRVSVRAAAVAVFAFVILALILYRAGVYDISFIERPETDPPETDAPDTKDTSTSPGDDTTLPPDTPDTNPPINQDEFEAFLEKIPLYSSLAAEGWDISGSQFSSGTHFLARLGDVPAASKKTFSFRRQVVNYTQRLLDPDEECYVTKFISEEQKKPAVTLWMGMILVDDGKTISLYNSSLKKLVSNFADVSFTSARDKDGHPIVLYNEEYYSVDIETGQFTKVSFNPETDSSPIFFDVPIGAFEGINPVEYYPYSEEFPVEDEPGPDEETTPSESDTNPPDEETISPDDDTTPPDSETDGSDMLLRSQSGFTLPLSPDEEDEDGEEKQTVTLWGYKNRYGGIAIPAKYKKVYPFSSNGLAAVVDTDGNLFYINVYGSPVIQIPGLSKGYNVIYPEERAKRWTDHWYLPAETDGTEYLGMYMFDHGLVRVRYVWTDHWSKKTVKDTDLLLYADGTEFEIPGGYTLFAYSEGIAVLGKNEYFGYFDYNGRWLTSPSYTEARPFYQGLAVVGDSNGKYGLIDTEGKFILPCAFDYISDVSSGIIAAYTATDGWSLFAVMSK